MYSKEETWPNSTLQHKYILACLIVSQGLRVLNVDHLFSFIAKNIKALVSVESQCDTVKQGALRASYSLSPFHLLSFTHNKKCELLNTPGEQ